MSSSLAGKTLFITGASRGVGLAIGLRAAREGANVCVFAKTAAPHPRLNGTVYTAAADIDAAGGQALPIVGDVRRDDDVNGAVRRCAERFGGIDIVVNNASAIDLSGTLDLTMKAFDLMHAVNIRGTLLVTRACLPHLFEASNPHVLNLAPPINLDPRWFKAHLGNTIAKYGMSMCVLGMAAEFRDRGVAFNALWPRTYLATDAVNNLLGGEESMRRSRRPEIMGDAAHAILVRPARDCTGNFFIDDDVLRSEGITDFAHYRYGDAKEEDLAPDFFL
jgi:citronellol/citronellal dehydrogenase